ncbi:septum site-determining protein Ssd [Glycomyces harbinensis]|uniref:Helicase/secretion neighborhood CpaE-like protein n=1 Tax=Glycomyces harbinensis TaxID=58114 RepID=A0A1G7D781_9ACTN|nr:septum site-determining protein Ssd [Glycomyces harbinensis]SDE47383.1 helicase/secretion neighborhood CpaE-like protein [Glycomyces harbinensis]
MAATLDRTASTRGSANARGGPAAPAPAAESLLITGDDRLAETITPLAAASGHSLRRVTHPLDAAMLWQRAPMVLVGPDLAPECVACDFPARDHLVLCTTMSWLGADSADTSMLWPLAIQMRATGVVALPDARDWLIDLFTRTVRDVEPAPVIAHVAGHGGAGASTLALASATGAARDGGRVVLVDLDHTGGGIDAAAGLAAQPGWRWPSLANAGLLEPEGLLAGLPQRGGLHVVGPDPRNPAEVDADAFDQVLRAARLAADLVVVDLPRARTGAAARAAAAARSIAVTLGPGSRSWEAARSVTAAYGLHNPNLGVVLRGEAEAPPAGASWDGPREADWRDPPVWGAVPTDRRLPVLLRQGRIPRGRLGRGIHELTAELSRARPRGELVGSGADRTGGSR